MDDRGTYNKNDIEEAKDKMSGVEPRADDVCVILRSTHAFRGTRIRGH